MCTKKNKEVSKEENMVGCGQSPVILVCHIDFSQRCGLDHMLSRDLIQYLQDRIQEARVACVDKSMNIVKRGARSGLRLM
jgi:hypothetical protein